MSNHALKISSEDDGTMKATGIVRRIDDLGRVVIPKEIRRTMRIREGDQFQITLGEADGFIMVMMGLEKRWYIKA